MSTIGAMLDELVDREGGYVNDPNDSGGETNFGITIAVARAFGYHGDMRDMTRAQARDIYVKRYWIQPRFHDVSMQSEAIAEELFDSGVNCGTGRAATWLQRSLNVLNRNAKDFPDIEADGNIGAMTLASLRAFLKGRGNDGEIVLLRMLNGLQAEHYISLAEARPKDERFTYGWIYNRVGSLV